jgi:hypothetical protein
LNLLERQNLKLTCHSRFIVLKSPVCCYLALVFAEIVRLAGQINAELILQADADFIIIDKVIIQVVVLVID